MKKLFLLLFAAVLAAASLLLFRSPRAEVRPALQEGAPVVTAAPAEPAAPAAQPEQPTAAASADPLAAYQPVIDSYRRFLAGEEIEGGDETERGDYYLQLGETGISYLSRYGGTLGFCLRDLNGDDVPELLVGAEGGEYAGYLFDLFTLDGGAPKRVLASSERVRYRLRSDGLIFFEGSGGASYGIWFLYAFDGDSLRLTDGAIRKDELIFEVREDRPDPYEKTDGDLLLTEDELSGLLSAWDAMVTDFPLTPFA